MNTKVLSSVAAALVVTSFVPPAIAEPLGEHPAVVVARTWNNRGIDPNTFIVAHPASTRWVSEAPKTADKLAHASEPRKLHWSAAIGTGYAARSKEPLSSGVKPVVAAAHWTSRIGSGHPFDSNTPVTYASLADAQ